MNRRRVLFAVGVSAATLSLAGCTSDLGDDETNDDDSDATEYDETENGAHEPNASSGEDAGDSGTDASDESPVDVEDEFDEEPEDDVLDDDDGTAALIRAAEDTLTMAGAEFDAALEETDDPMDDESQAIETGPIDARLDEAEADLAAARDGATDDQLETIGALEGLVAFFRDFVDVFVAFGDAMDEFENWGRSFDREQWDDAVDAAERATSANGDARESLAAARSTFDDIDPDGLDDVDDVDYAELETALEEMNDVLAVLDAFFVGGGQLAAAMGSFEDAFDALEWGQFETAASAFSAAEEQCDGAYHTFAEAEADAPPEFRSDLNELACDMDAMSDSAGYYALGAEAYADGDEETGNAYFREGEAALEQCDSDTVAMSLVR